jgi:hypothetical protein
MCCLFTRDAMCHGVVQLRLEVQSTPDIMDPYAPPEGSVLELPITNGGTSLQILRSDRRILSCDDPSKELELIYMT